MKIGRVLLVVAGLLALLSTILPVWGMDMVAPQYPQGLKVKVYPGNLEGDLPIINVLNHYVGMRELRLEDFFLVQILPYLFGFIGLGLVLSGLLSKRILAWIMVVLLLLTAAVGFVELRRNLVEYGTNLDPMAPLDLDPFIPPLMGRYQVWNFTMTNHFMAGTYLMVIASLLAITGVFQMGEGSTGKKKTAAKAKLSGEKGRRQTQYVGIFLLLALALSIGTAAEAASAASAHPGEPTGQTPPEEIIVTPGGSPTLAEALAAVAEGGTVRLRPGVYEGPIVVERGVTLIADGHPGLGGAGMSAKETAAEIVGRAEEDLVVVQDGASLIGLIVRHEGTLIRSDFAAVRVYGHGSTLFDNTIQFDTAHGIYVERGGDNIVTHNRVIGLDRQAYIDDRGNGIYLFDTIDNIVAHNRFELARDAIYVQFADENVIVDNEITKSRYGIHTMFSKKIVYDSNRHFRNVIGSAFMYSSDMDITNNLIADHTDHRGYAILLKTIDRNRLTNNFLVGNHVGMFFESSDDNIIEDNIFAVNNTAIEVFSSSNRNRIVRNTFIGNRSDTSLQTGRHTTIWFTEETGGNHWDTYRGVDVDGFGFGALPHTSSDPFGYLSRNNPELHAFFLSPAVDVLSWAEKAFPLLRAPRAVDEKPRVQPDRQGLDALRKQLLITVGKAGPIQEAPGGAGSFDPRWMSWGLLIAGVGLVLPLLIRPRPVILTER